MGQDGDDGLCHSILRTFFNDEYMWLSDILCFLPRASDFNEDASLGIFSTEKMDLKEHQGPPLIPL